MSFDCAVIGASAGGLFALKKLFSLLPQSFTLPIIVVQHISKDETAPSFLTILQSESKLIIKEAEEKESIQPSTIYFAPVGYHCLVEKDRTFSLSMEIPNCFSIPGIDPLFETAAETYQDKLIGVILTGASSDGSLGLRRVKELGGKTIVQCPAEAESSLMPKSALSMIEPDSVISLNEIAKTLIELSK